LSPMDEYKRQSLPFINVSTQWNVDYAVCGNANKQRLFAVQGANRKELFESNWKKYPYIIDWQRSEDLNINSYYPQRPYSIGYFDNKVLIPDIIQNVYGYGYNKLSQYAMTNMFSANADNRGITCIKNTVDKVFIFYTDRKTGWNSYIINTDTPADYFSVSFPKFVMRQSIIKTLNNLKIWYNFMKDSDKIQVFVSVNDYYFWVFKPKWEFIIPEKGEAYNYWGIPWASNRLLFERIDTINNEPRLVFHLEGNITEFYFTSDLYSDSWNHILVEDFTNFVFVWEETSKWFWTWYFEIWNISQKINAPKVQKMQFKVVWYGYAEIFDSEFTSYLTNNV
jgi:hypothetical protein